MSFRATRSSPLPTSSVPPDRCANAAVTCGIAVLRALQDHDADYMPEVELLISRLESLESAAFIPGGCRVGTAVGWAYPAAFYCSACDTCNRHRSVCQLLMLIPCLLGRQVELLLSPGCDGAQKQAKA